MTARDGADRAPTTTDPAPTVLVIEDEMPIRRAVRHALTSGTLPVTGRVVEAGTAAEGLAHAAAERPTLVILDLGLPDSEGLDVCRELRAWSRAAILVLSARHSDVEKATLLDAGADDYLTKPFSVLELQARVRALLRRAAASQSSADGQGAGDPVVAGELVIDRARRVVTRAGVPVHLTPVEWTLLATLVAHADRPLTHRQLFTAVWPNRRYGDAQAYLRVHVAHLRRKLEPDVVRPRHLRTDAGVGYRFVP